MEENEKNKEKHVWVKVDMLNFVCIKCGKTIYFKDSKLLPINGCSNSLYIDDK